MRILFISTYDRPEFQRKLDLIANCQDLELHCIIPDHSSLIKGFRNSDNGQKKYYVHKIALKQMGKNGDPHRQFYQTLDFNICKFKPDLIHCEHEQEGLLAAQTVLARNMFSPQTPLVMYSWQNLIRKRSLPVLAICNYTLKNAQHITCASSEGINVLQKQGFVGTYDISPMIGIDHAIFYPYPSERVNAIRTSLAINSDDLVIGFVGRLSPEKSIDTLLNAISKMKTICKVLIIGSGESELELKKLATNLEIMNRCHFVGFQQNNQIADFINALDVLVLPSKTMPYWKEQFGRVLVEAMLCKRIVVGSDSGAIPEVINQPECIFPEQDVLSLTNILDKVINDVFLRKKLIEANYNRAKSLFAVEKVASQNIECWKHILNPAKGIHTA